jgi:hypothetical protein
VPSWRSAHRTTSAAEAPRRRVGPAALALALALLACGPAGAAAAAPEAPSDTLPLWRALDWFAGRWQGAEDSSTGEGRALRCVGEVLGGRVLLARSNSEVMEASPQDRYGARLREGTLAQPGLQGHERWQFVARDPDDGRITLDQYDSSGYRSSFVLDAAASRPDRYLFRSEDVGYGVAATRGTLEWRLRGADRFVEILSLAVDGAEPAEVARHRWRRTGEPGDCAGDLPAPGRAFD